MNQVDSQRRYGKGRKVPKTDMKRLKIIQGPLIHAKVSNISTYTFESKSWKIKKHMD